MLIWITGISGAGKSTIGLRLYKKLKQQLSNLVYLDGDEFRKIMGNDIQYRLEDRDKNAYRMTHTCKLLCEQGIHVICGANLTSQKYRDWCREEIPGYFEIFLDVPMDVLFQRDSKKLYSRALSGELKNVVGVDIPFTPPKSPDLIINNGQVRESFTDVLDLIISESNILQGKKVSSPRPSASAEIR